MGRKPNELTGRRFGRLVALERTHRQAPAGLNYYWKCRCDCGKITEVHTGNLQCGRVISCGCTRQRRINNE